MAFQTKIANKGQNAGVDNIARKSFELKSVRTPASSMRAIDRYVRPTAVLILLVPNQRNNGVIKNNVAINVATPVTPKNRPRNCVIFCSDSGSEE